MKIEYVREEIQYMGDGILIAYVQVMKLYPRGGTWVSFLPFILAWNTVHVQWSFLYCMGNAGKRVSFCSGVGVLIMPYILEKDIYFSWWLWKLWYTQPLWVAEGNTCSQEDQKGHFTWAGLIWKSQVNSNVSQVENHKIFDKLKAQYDFSYRDTNVK